MWCDKTKPIGSRGNSGISHVVGNGRVFQVGCDCFCACVCVLFLQDLTLFKSFCTEKHLCFSSNSLMTLLPKFSVISSFNKENKRRWLNKKGNPMKLHLLCWFHSNCVLSLFFFFAFPHFLLNFNTALFLFLPNWISFAIFYERNIMHAEGVFR